MHERKFGVENYSKQINGSHLIVDKFFSFLSAIVAPISSFQL